MSIYCEGGDCKCRVTQVMLKELVKDKMITGLNACPSTHCGHEFGLHPSQATSSTAPSIAKSRSLSPAASPSGSAKEGRDYGSFRKKVLRREGYDPARLPDTIPCQICGENVVSTTIQAAHILDLNQRELLFEQYKTDSEHFPVSINHPDNGMLACLSCHALFDNPQKHISLEPDGSLKFSATAVKDKKYKTLKDKKATVLFSAKIGTKDYPSAEFIEWAANQKKGEKTRRGAKRTLSFTSSESDDEDSPKTKKQKTKTTTIQKPTRTTKKQPTKPTKPSPPSPPSPPKLRRSKRKK